MDIVLLILLILQVHCLLMDVNRGGKEFVQGDMEVTPGGDEYAEDK